MPKPRRLLAVCLSAALLPASAFAQTAQPSAPPVNPDATPAARALLREIDAISGQGTLSGEHNFPNTVSRYSDRIFELTQHYPAIFGQDFGFSAGEDKDSTLGRPSMIEEVIRQYRAGAVIALTWHAVRPTDDEPVTFRDSVQGHLTDWEWKQVLTPGTDLYLRWERQVDVIAGFLHELQDAGVPVLFRPFHEMNGNWFWWGGRPGPEGSQALYRQIYDRYVHKHHLNNLIWVWNVNAPSGNAGAVDTYYPGNGYADIITMDIYGPFEQSYYDSMLAIAGPTRPIALAEVGTMPTLDVLAKQPRWAYFMMWSGSAEGSNTPEQLQTMFHAPNVIDRGDPRLPKPLPAPTEPPAPVTTGATPEAHALLARLYQAKGRETLRGEAVATSSGAASGQGPAVREFTLNSEVPETLRPAIRDAAKSGHIVMLRWMPPRPTDNAVAGPLTDFEWRQLLAPHSALNAAWIAQVDNVAILLKHLQADHVPVLWSPYPEANAHTSWWAGRAGPEGSAALGRMLYQRLTEDFGLKNLVWNWEPALPGFGTEGNGGWADFYPGPLYVDTVTLDVAKPSAMRFNPARMLQAFAGGKPIGLRLEGATAPLPDTQDHNWQWVLTPPTP